jgi:hypothetical protein
MAMMNSAVIILYFFKVFNSSIEKPEQGDTCCSKNKIKHGLSV